MKFKFNIKKYLIVIIGALLLSGVLYANNCVLVYSFEQCMYGLLKIEGSSSAPVLYATMYILVCFIFICPLSLLPVLDFGKKFCINIRNNVWQIYPIKNIKVYGIVLLLIGVFCLLSILKFFPFVRSTIFSSTELFDDYYVDAGNVDVSFPGEKRNLIYIFVESLESSSTSIKNGGFFEESIIPNLEKMALENINFSNNNVIGGASPSFGTGWTVAAMISHTSGVPLKMTFDDINVNSTRFEKITNMGDILSDNGYNSYLLLGSDADFGGRRAYFANHNYLIKDYETAVSEGFIDSDYFEWWGYEDSKLFSYAKDMLLDISKDDKPFNLTMLTANTHFTDGYLDSGCEEVFDDSYADSFYCSDNMINEFIGWVKEQDFYEDTTIVIVGDHLTMQNRFYSKKYDDNRRIFNVFINAKVDNYYSEKNRVFTSLDLFPTTLASIGADIKGDRLGLGTNLFSNKQTVPEIMGIDKFNEEIMKGSHYYYNNIR